MIVYYSVCESLTPAHAEARLVAKVILFIEIIFITCISVQYASSGQVAADEVAESYYQ